MLDGNGALPRGQPIVLLARGGSGSRLLAVLARDAGVFLGNDLNRSQDSLEMVEAVYGAVTAKLTGARDGQAAACIVALQRAAEAMLSTGGRPETWGFKLPECMLIPREIRAAFPGAYFVHLIRDPLATCLRRTHMTARPKNPIGRLTVPEAYRHCGVDHSTIGADSPAIHMAYTTIHQLETVLNFLARVPEDRQLEIRFENLLADPLGQLTRFCQALGLRPESHALTRTVDPARAGKPTVEYAAPVVRQAERILAPLRRRLGYQ